MREGIDLERQVGPSQRSLVGHVKNFRLYSEGDGAFVTSFKMASD